MKRIIAIVLCMMILLSIQVYGSETTIDVRVNGSLLVFDSEPFIYESRTMVPVRAIVEALGADDIMWNEGSKKVTIVYEGFDYELIIGSKTILMGGIPREMDVAPMISNGRTMLPLRYVAEAFGCDVEWNEALRAVEITKEGLEVGLGSNYTLEDLLWLSRIVNVEGLDIGYEAKLAIANVVLNRVKGDEYPDTVYDVIMDDNYAIQFPPAHKESFKTFEPNDESVLAARNALNGENNIDDCLYFNHRPFKWKADDLYKVIDGEYFYH